MTEEPISKSELGNHLLGACDILRGPINQDEYKSYITPLLFFKRISDVYDEETTEALEMSDGDEDYAALPENHSFAVPDGCHWQDVRNTGANVGKAIVDAMVGIERANPDTLSGLFSSFDDASWTDKGKLSDERLKDLVEHFSAKKFGNRNYSADMMGDAYEYLIKKFADMQKKNAGEFYTPREIVKMMVSLLEPKPGETVYDPTCGSAGMLISSIAHLKQHGEEWRNVHAYGQEINQLSSAIGRMNLFLHGVEDFEIANDDTLRHPAFLEAGKLRTFDMVLANPPYSIKQWDREAFASDPYGRNFLGTPPQGRADYAFIQHILKSMDPHTGRCSILLPHGVLFRNEESEMRERLVRSDLVEAVIGLGANLFFNSPMEACILICRSEKAPNRSKKILFVDASAEVTRKNAQSYLEPQHIKRIVDAYRSDEDIEGFSSHASFSELEGNAFSLSIPLYVKPSNDENADDRSIEETVESWRAASTEAASLLDIIAAKLHENDGE